MVQPAAAEFSYPSTASIPILLGKSNFVSWNRAVTTMLYGGGWWRYVCEARIVDANTVFDPDLKPVYAPAMPLYGIAATAVQLAAHTKWARGDAVALHIITSRLDNAIAHIIPSPFGPHGRTTAQDAWVIINRDFNSTAFSHTSLLRTDLKRLRLGTDMDEYIRLWNEGRTNLYNAGDPMREDKSVRLFLDGLPRNSSWRPFIDRAADNLEDNPQLVSRKDVTDRAHRISTRDAIWKREKTFIYTNVDKSTTNPFVPRASKLVTRTTPRINLPDIVTT